MEAAGTLAPDSLDARQFEIAVRRLADALAYGQESSPFLGAGIEYVQSRPYQPGDPVRFIDWRITGRTGRYHVKEYEAPKQMPVYLLVDTSASMTVSSVKMSKYAWAVQIAGGLALAAVEHMSPAGVMGVGERELHHTPSLSRGVVMRWLHELRRYDFHERTTLGERIRKLVTRVENRCLFVIVSDLHDPDAVPAIRLMAQNHDCMVIRLVDPAEDGALRAGVFRGEEAESGRGFTGHGRTRFLPENIGADFARAGIDYLLLRTDGPVLRPLCHFLKNRRTRKKA